MFAQAARIPQKPQAQRRQSWRVDARILRITLATASDGASRSAHLAVRAWPMRRALVISLSCVAMWS
jgi:hypothetical protein